MPFIDYTKNEVATSTVKGGYTTLMIVPNIAVIQVGNSSTIINGQSTAINATRVDGQYDIYKVEEAADFDSGEKVEMTGPKGDVLILKGANSGLTGTYKLKSSTECEQIITELNVLFYSQSS